RALVLLCLGMLPVLPNSWLCFYSVLFLFFFNDTATTEIYTLSLHDALPICPADACRRRRGRPERAHAGGHLLLDRKSTRLNSSHRCISYAVFRLKKNDKRYRALVATAPADPDVRGIDGLRNS